MKKLFKNCLTVIESDGWYKPLRFTENQLEEYFKTEGKKARSLAPSSVCLSFYTESDKIDLQYRIGLKARDWASFDLSQYQPKSNTF